MFGAGKWQKGCVVALLTALAFNVCADEIELSSGEVLHGEVVEQNFQTEQMKVMSADGRLKIVPLNQVKAVRKQPTPPQTLLVSTPEINESSQPYPEPTLPSAKALDKTQFAKHSVSYTFGSVGYYLEDIGDLKVTYDINIADVSYQRYFGESYGVEVGAYAGSGAEITLDYPDTDPNTQPTKVSSDTLTEYDDASVQGVRLVGLVGWGLAKPGVVAYLAPGLYTEQVRFNKTSGGTKEETVSGLCAKFAIGYSWKHFATGFWGNFRMGAPDGFKPNRSTQGGWMFGYRF